MTDLTIRDLDELAEMLAANADFFEEHVDFAEIDGAPLIAIEIHEIANLAETHRAGAAMLFGLADRLAREARRRRLEQPELVPALDGERP